MTLVQRYLAEAAEAEKNGADQLDHFASDGDDSEVQDAFRAYAAKARLHSGQLEERLRELGVESDSEDLSVSEAIKGSLPIESGRIVEERVLQNLITSHAAEMGRCALYRAAGFAASTAGDLETEELARQIQAERQAAAAKFWHLIPTRSKISFNMLTVAEVDPSVETKTGENRLLES